MYRISFFPKQFYFCIMIRIPILLKHIFCFVLVCLFAGDILAQGGLQLRKNIDELNAAKSLEALKKSERNFAEMIAEGKKVKQAYYYAALSSILVAFDSEPGDVDDYCSKADNYLKKLDSLSPDNSEIVVLFAMNASAKIKADPKVRQAKFGPMANKFSERALMLNAENPRAHLIKAKTVYNSPAKVGGGPKYAIKHYEKALEKFKIFKPLADTEPDWGEEMAKKELAECKEKLKTQTK